MPAKSGTAAWGPRALAAAILLAFWVPYLKLAASTWPGLAALVHDPAWRQAARNSLLLADLAVLAAVPLGTLAAWAVWRAPAWPRRLMVSTAVLTLIVPQGLAAAWRGVWPGGWAAPAPAAMLLAAHALICASVVFLLVSGAGARLDPNAMRAAASSGAGPWVIAWRVVLPFMAPRVAIAALAAFAVSLGETGMLAASAEPGRQTAADLLTAALVALPLLAAAAVAVTSHD